jgi:hypothetical protein
MIPKITFRYSRVYDMDWCLALNEKFDKQVNYNNFKKCLVDLRSYLTKKKEQSILSLISKYSKFKWNKKEIMVYFVNCLPGKLLGFSDPLTIKIIENHLSIILNLIHELAHNILERDLDHKHRRRLSGVYPNNDEGTIEHLIVNSLSKKVFLEIFGETNFNKAIKELIFAPSEKKAWDIIKKESYEGIIKEFTSRIKQVI